MARTEPDVQVGDVIKLTQDWTVVTQGQKYVVLGDLTSKRHGEAWQLGLIEHMPDGDGFPKGAWSAMRYVPKGWCRVDKAATAAWREANSEPDQGSAATAGGEAGPDAE